MQLKASGGAAVTRIKAPKPQRAPFTKKKQKNTCFRCPRCIMGKGGDAEDYFLHRGFSISTQTGARDKLGGLLKRAALTRSRV